MEKNRIIIVEGPQGTGKTTLTNYLRDNIASSNLYRLAGQKDKSLVGKYKSIEMYNALLEYMAKMQQIEMDLIFDRTFFTEEVYARLGYKEYSFTDEYNKLIKKLEYLSVSYQIYLVLLYLKDENLYQTRLARDAHHNYQEFSRQNSINQQNVYRELGYELQEKSSPIEVVPTAMDDFTKSYRKINGLFRINN